MSSRAPRVLAPPGATAPGWLLSGLRWYRKAPNSDESPQALCFAAADEYEREHGVPTTIIKWGQYMFAFLPTSHIDVLYDMLDDCRPRGTRGIPEYYVLARSPRPHQFCLDIESKIPIDVVSDDEFYTRVEGIIGLYERFIREYHQHMCRVKAYIVRGSRPCSDTHYKHSYHVLLRCDKRCCFTDCAQWREFSLQFMAYLQHADILAANPWLEYEGSRIYDTGIYTEHRAMRIPGSGKDANGIPLTYCPLPATSPYAVPCHEHDDLRYHLHCWSEPRSCEFAMLQNEQVVVRLPHLRARPQHRPLPAPLDDECTEHILNILQVLIPGQAMYSATTMTISAGTSWARTLTALLRLEFSDLARGILYEYRNWWRVCCLIARYVGDGDAGRDLWLYYAREKMPHAAARNQRGEITQYENGERQWRAATTRLAHNQPATIHGFHRDMQWLADILNVEWQAYTPDDPHESYPCPASDARHNTVRAHIDRDMFEDDGSIMIICHCGKHIFCGYMTEKGASISNDRYISNNERLVRLLRASFRTQAMIQCKRTICIASQMGTGKSSILEHLRDLQPDKGVLVISVRRLLSEDLWARLRQFIPDIQHYIRCKTNGQKTLAEANRLVCQLDSIYKLICNGEVNTYPVVILEELRSLLAHLSSSTLEKRRRVICQMLMYIITEAKVVIALDADLDPCSYQFLRSLRHNTTFDIFRNLSTPCARTHVVIKHETTWYTHLRNKLRARKKIFVVSNCKRRIDGIYNEYNEEYRCLIYTSKTPQQQKLSVSDCNRLWLQYDIVMVSPVVSAGLNFSEVYFDCIMAYLKAGSACARESCQQEGRVRTMVGQQIVYTYIDNRVERANLDCVATVEGCLEYINQGLASNFELAAPLLASVQELDFSTGRFGLTPESPVDQVFLENMAESVRSQQNYYQAYKRQCLKHGDRVRYMSDKLDDEVSRMEINKDAREADDDDSMSLSQSQRPGDAGQAMDDLQTGEHAVDPNSLIQEQWCALLNVKTCIDEVRVWDVIKRTGALRRLLVCMLVLHPSPHRVYQYIAASMIQQQLREPPDQLARFIRDTVAPYERMLGGYDQMIQRANLVRTLVEAVFGDVNQTARNIEEPFRTWLNTGDNLRIARVECPRVKWDDFSRATAKKAIREVLALADLTVDAKPSAVAINRERLDIMQTLSHLACRDLYAPRGGVLPRELSL